MVANFQRLALMSYTNLDEDYQRRFLMTSLVGFIYRVFDEYKIDPETRLWNEVNDEDKIDNQAIYSMWTLDKMEGNIGVLDKYINDYKIFL